MLLQHKEDSIKVDYRSTKYGCFCSRITKKCNIFFNSKVKYLVRGRAVMSNSGSVFYKLTRVHWIVPRLKKASETFAINSKLNLELDWSHQQQNRSTTLKANHAPEFRFLFSASHFQIFFNCILRWTILLL